MSLLLKDSFIDSFPSRDQPFIKVHIVGYNFLEYCEHEINILKKLSLGFVKESAGSLLEVSFFVTALSHWTVPNVSINLLLKGLLLCNI